METRAATAIREGLPSDGALMLEIDGLGRSQAERAALLRESLRQGQCLVVEADCAVRGLVVLNYSFFGFGFIPLVVVSATHRRAGLGLRLILAAEARCTSAKLFSSANASNDAAHALFGRAGFKRSGVVENLDEGDSEIVYFKRCQHHDR